jgi:hypothetical protein
MNRTTFAARLIAATASIVVTFGLFQSIAALGAYDRLDAAQVARAATTAPRVPS